MKILDTVIQFYNQFISIIYYIIIIHFLLSFSPDSINLTYLPTYPPTYLPVRELPTPSNQAIPIPGKTTSLPHFPSILTPTTPHHKPPIMPSLLPRNTRLLRTLPKRLQPLNSFRTPLRTPFQIRTLSSKPQLDPISLHRAEATRNANQKRRLTYLTCGFLLGMVSIWVTATSIDLPPPNKLDSSRPHESLIGAPVIIKGEEDLVQTGTSSIPTFPKYIQYSDAISVEEKVSHPPEEYQLLGLGIRTVSFLAIQVYVVGIYISTSTISNLQTSLLQKAAPGGASTLVAGEKEELKKLLLHESEGEQIWNEILQSANLKTLIRIVPTRNTDFHHMRDAWVRSLTVRAQKNRAEFGDAQFGLSMGEFKALFNRGSVAKGREMLLNRDANGVLRIWCEDAKMGRTRLGEVHDERISRGIWLGYLAGAQVSSEMARRSVVDGIMGFLERPVGTVEGQVHV